MIDEIRAFIAINLDLRTSLNLAVMHGARVVRWGPYPIDAELYNRAMAHIAYLESGNLEYKAVDTGYSTRQASNCIHAISDLARQGRLRIASPGWGHFASWACVCKLRPWILDPECDCEWVAEKLGLNAYPIERRSFARGASASSTSARMPSGMYMSGMRVSARQNASYFP